MFKTKAARVAAFVLIVAGAAVFISCQDGTTAPTQERIPQMDEDEYLGIDGYTRDEEGGEIIDAWVVWGCETCAEVLGDDVTNVYGYYQIWRTESVWLEHSGHDFKGTATHPEYEEAYATIDDFSYQVIPYPRDFEMTPK